MGDDDLGLGPLVVDRTAPAPGPATAPVPDDPAPPDPGPAPPKAAPPGSNSKGAPKSRRGSKSASPPEDELLGLLGPEDVLGEEAVGALRPPEQGPGSLTDARRRELEEALRNDEVDDDETTPVIDVVALFDGAPGNTEEARDVWSRWHARLYDRRLTKDLNAKLDWKEDLQYGPRDEPGTRLFSGAFVRDAQTGEILWDVYKNSRLVAHASTPADVIKAVEAAAEVPGTHVRFEPCRHAPIVDLPKPPLRRDADPATGATKGARRAQIEQSAPFRRKSRTSASFGATRSIKAQIISIRLNAHHWEWSYSRWLKNHGMFDTPSMTPYIDAKLKAHETSVAVPLLTRGTLGFSGVALEGEALYQRRRATVAIASREQLTNEWTLARLRGLPRLSRTSNNVDGSDFLEALSKERGPTVTAADGGDVMLLFLDSEGNVDRSTIFAIADPGGGGRAFYANTHWFDSALAGLWAARRVRGYDSWADGEGRAAILASTDDARRKQRLELAYEGLPLFFGKKSSLADGGGFVDVRVTHDDNWDGKKKSTKKTDNEGDAPTVDSVRPYSEVYRELMFAPMPVRGVPTLPSARTKPATGRPRCLNFTLTDSNASGEGGIVRFLKQRYPEVTMHGLDRNARLKFLGTLFTKTQASKRMEAYDWWTDDVEKVRLAVTGPGSNQVTESPEFQTLMKKLDELPELAPTTLEGVMARYMAEHGGVLAYPGANGGELLRTSHRPGGVYFSCRVDTGTKRGEGGLDSRFPVPMDADVYEIADFNLARGVHDYVYPESSVERAGPPAWWADEQESMHENLPLAERDEGLDPYRFDAAKAHYFSRYAKPIASVWTDGVEASVPPTEAELARLPTIETARPLYQHFPGVDARASRFAASQMRRLDTATGFPEPAEAGGPPDDRVPTWPLHYALIDQSFNRKETPLHPTGLCVPTTTKVSKKSSIMRPPRAHATQAVLFDTFYPIARGAQPRDAQTDARAVVEALPHRHDARVPCMPIYPSRLSLHSLENVKTMVTNLLQTAGGATDVVTDATGRQARSTASKGAKKGAKSDLGTRTLVAPLYVVALDYDDFKQAVETGDKEWHAFFAAHPNYWKEKDRFRVVDGSLEPNLDYVFPSDEDPVRGEGRWATHDGPWVDDDPEVVRLSDALRANGAAIRAKRAAKERVKELTDARRALRAQLHAAQAAVADELQLAYAARPAERMRDSWFEDRYEFGRLKTEPAGDDAPADALKQRVVEWERMYAVWMEDQRSLDYPSALERAVEGRTAALRDASLRLCWGLSRLASARDAPQELYEADGELPLLDDATLARQRMRNDGVNQLKEMRTRLSLPLFLLDVLDHLDDVQEHTQWFARQHLVVARLQSKLNRTRHRYLCALKAIGTPNWPDQTRVDCITRVAGNALNGLVAHLGGTLAGATEWAVLGAQIDAFLRTVASPPAPDDDGDAADPDGNALAGAHRDALRSLLRAWVARIVQERVQSLVTGDEDAPPRVAMADLERAVVAPLSDVGTGTRVAELRAAAILFGLKAFVEGDDDDGGVVLQYARELQLVGGLLHAQRELVVDTQVFGNELGLTNRSWEYSKTAEDKKDHVLISYTADAFSRLFVSVNADPLVWLNTLLENAMKGEMELGLDALMDELKAYYPVVAKVANVEERDDPSVVPQAFYAAISIVKNALTEWNAPRRRQMDRLEASAGRLQVEYERWQKSLQELTRQQEALLGAFEATGEADAATKQRLQGAMDTNDESIGRTNKTLETLNRIIASKDQDLVDQALARLVKKRRRATPPAPAPAAASSSREEDAEMADAAMVDADPPPPDADPPPPDDGSPMEVQGLFDDVDLSDIMDEAARLNPKEGDQDNLRELEAMLGTGTATRSAFEFADTVLTGFAPAKEALRKEVVESARQDALAPYRKLGARLTKQAKAQRARVASLRAEREAAIAAFRRAIAAARAELLSPDALDAAAQEDRRARLNAALGDVATSPGGELSYSTYLARLEGFGIDDPGACNDDDLAVIDKHELFGWKSEYRRYVARLLRVVDNRWSVDEAVLSPAEWLERSGNAQFAPGPPRPSQARVDAASAADAAALRAASLEQAVKGIVGTGGGEDAARVESSLSHLLEADRRCMARVGWPWRAPYAFDFDGHAPSSVVARAE